MYMVHPSGLKSRIDKSGIVSTPHGLRIACLGGIHNPGIYDTSDGPPVCNRHSVLPDLLTQEF